MFQLPTLPYSKSALEPFISAETLNYHYEKHHKTYVDKTNELIQGTKYENHSLEEIILEADDALFNNASQAWNHSFYWMCMCAADRYDRKQISDELALKMEGAFGSIAQFKELFTEKAMQVFGSGWIWLVMDAKQRLSIITLPNADSPIRYELIPLLTCDVWEHAYYIDYRNNRRRYVDGFLNAIDWGFVNTNFEFDHFPNMTKLMLNSNGMVSKQLY